MGFLDAVVKIIAGKPVFEPEGQQSGSGGQSVTPPAGPKAIPVVRVGRVECNVSGQRLDVYADIHNESHDVVYLDRILLAGRNQELDSQLNAGQSRQYHIYAGPLLASPPHRNAELQYRKQADGDYFADFHEVRTKQEGSQGHLITELLLRGPVRDI